MKKEKRVEKWISLGALSLVASLQERSALQNRMELRQCFLERENNRVLPSAWNRQMSEWIIASWYAKKRVAWEGVIEAAQRVIKKPST